MKHFIFLTQEGFTKTPANADIENLQVLGIAQGKNKEKAFETFVQESEYLLQSDFNEVVAMELTDETQHNFSLKDHAGPLSGV